jgi:hypothetical protein
MPELLNLKLHLGATIIELANNLSCSTISDGVIRVACNPMRPESASGELKTLCHVPYLPREILSVALVNYDEHIDPRSHLRSHATEDTISQRCKQSASIIYAS